MSAADPAAADLQTLHEPWPDRTLQMQAYTFGLWCFLATELLFFGAMFASFSVARHLHHAGFNAGTRETSLLYGTINTAVLLTSSLTMALAERGSEAGMRRLAEVMLAATILLGLTFLVVKGLEYREDLEKHLWPGRDFSIPVSGAALFFGLYWMMTAVHGVHVIIGLALVSRVLWIVWRGRMAERKVSVRMTTLYWHLVDVIWVVLFPLLYLGGRT